MDPPHGLPEGSSPVVLLPASPQFPYSISRAQVTTNSGSRTTTARPASPVHRHTLNTNPYSRLSTRTTTTRSAGRDSQLIRMRTGPSPSVREATALYNAEVAAATSISTSESRTSSSFSVIGSRGNVASATGPTTRSRFHSHAQNALMSFAPHNTVRSTNSTTVQPPATAPSRKRKAPPSEEKRIKAPRNTRCRKKPPPGVDLKKAPPQAKYDKEDDQKPEAKIDCCICMCDVEPDDVAKIDGCDHRFCFGCIEKWSERENRCPLCKARFHKIERVRKKRGKGKNSKKVKQKDQRSELSSGAAIEGLIANLHRNSGLARIIFSSLEVGGTGPAAAISTSRSSSGVRAEFADSSDDSDDESPMAAFMRALHGSSVANGISMSHTVVRPISLTTHITTRSFARNVHDSTAGSGADNPLEIDDDSVDEVIEID